MANNRLSGGHPQPELGSDYASDNVRDTGLMSTQPPDRHDDRRRTLAQALCYAGCGNSDLGVNFLYWPRFGGIGGPSQPGIAIAAQQTNSLARSRPMLGSLPQLRELSLAGKPTVRAHPGRAGIPCPVCGNFPRRETRLYRAASRPRWDPCITCTELSLGWIPTDRADPGCARSIAGPVAPGLAREPVWLGPIPAGLASLYVS